MGIESVSGVSNYQVAGSEKSVKITDKADGINPAAESNVIQENAGKVAAASQTGQQNGYNDAEGKAGGEKEKETTMEDVKNIRKIINNNTVAEFGYNEPTNRITIKIKDKDTDEVIKEIPSDKALEMLAKAWELAGIMVDEKR